MWKLEIIECLVEEYANARMQYVRRSNVNGATTEARSDYLARYRKKLWFENDRQALANSN